MVIEVLHGWEQLFHAIDAVRGDRIDAVRIRYRSDDTDRMISKRWPVRTAKDLLQIKESFPSTYRQYGFSRFEIEAGDDEIVGTGSSDAVILRVMLVTAS